MSSRYVYYLIILIMFSNIVTYVPNILIVNREHGAVLAMGLAVFIGLFFIWSHSKIISKFPRMSVMDILKGRTPKWFYTIYFLFFGIMWFIAGHIVLQILLDLTERYLHPEINMYMVIFMFFLLVLPSALMNSKQVLYYLELILIINIPVILIIFFKSFTNEYLSLDSIGISLTHTFEWPKWTAISAASYIFMGYTHLMVFNKVIDQIRINYWVIGFLGLFVLSTTYFIPIGFHGFDFVDHYSDPSIATADSMRIEFGFVERVIYIFLFLYICVALMNVIVIFHVGKEMLQAITKELFVKNINITPVLIVSIFAFTSVLLFTFVDIESFVRFSTKWLSTIIPFQLTGLIILKWVARRCE